MRSNRSLEGYLWVDPGEGPTLSREQAAATGKGVVGAGAKAVVELPTVTCSHCHTIAFVRPGRTRARPWCRKCASYLCDGCAGVAHLSGECLPMTKVLDVGFEQAQRDPALVLQAVADLRRSVLGA